MTTITEPVLIEDRTLANLIWRKFGRQPEGFIEKVMELNPGVSATEFVPVGTVLVFPISEMEVPKQSADVVRLWD